MTLIIGAALLPASVLLRPTRREQLWIGIISGIAALAVAGLHLRAMMAGISFVHPSILASVSFLFGPLAGGVAVLISLFRMAFHTPYSWWMIVGLSVSLWGVGSVLWLARERTRLNFWLLFFLLVLLVPMFITPWTVLTQSVRGDGWEEWNVVPWRYMVGVVMLSGGVGLLISRARVLQNLRTREVELVQALRASGGGRWEWNLPLKRLSYHGSFFQEFGFDDSPDDNTLAPLKVLHLPDKLAALKSRVNQDDFKRLQAVLVRLGAGNVEHFHEEFRMRDASGKWRHLIARGSVVQRDDFGHAERLSGMLLDVTEHHAMASAVRLSEAKHTIFFKTLPDPAGIVRISDLRYIDVNPAAERWVGMPAAHIIGKTSEEIGLHIEQKDLCRLMSLLTNSEHVNGFPMRMRIGDTVFPGALSGCRTDIDGEGCVVFVFHDMTDSHAVQERLKTANDLLHQASWLARLGSWEGIPGKGVTYWSDICCEIHGVPAGTPAPTHYIDRFVAPEWRESVRNLSQIEREDRTVWDMEFEIIRADGIRVWVRARSETVMENGKLLKVRGVLQDIDKLRRTSERMLASEVRFERIFHSLPVPLGFVRDDTGEFVDVNPAWVHALGYSREESIGHSLVDLNIYSYEARQRLKAQTHASGQLAAYENELRTRSGAKLTVLQSMSSIEIAGQSCWLISVLDITERKQQESLVREREELLSLTIAAAAIGLWDWDLQTGTVRGDARWHELHGRSGNREILADALPWEDGVNIEQLKMIEGALQQHALNPSVPFDITWRISPPHAPTRWLRNVGKIVSFDTSRIPLRMLGVAIDVTMQHEQQELLHHMAHYDALTGLPNRVLLEQRLRAALDDARESGAPLAVAYIDLDALKAINDSLGHEVGDRLLVMVAGRLQRAVRPADTVARLSGDEFSVLLCNVGDREAAEKRLRTLMETLGSPYELEAVSLDLTASVGYTYFPDDTSDTDTLLRHADQAMYLAKQAGGNRLRAFDSVKETARQSLVEQRTKFEHAMNNGELSLYLQPKINMRTGTVIGAEALVRWVHPEHGVILPGSFLHVIDGTELEAKFSEWAMDSVLQHIEALKAQGLEMQISVNIDAERLRHRDFANWVRTHLERHPEVPPHQLDLEITENAALYDVTHVASELAQLRAIGVSVSLDDFGTGYSSLAYLRRLPIDQVKLDQSYVRGMMQDPADQAIVQGVIGLARSFGYRIVAEGVETAEQGVLLARMGCLIVQGHGISRPMPAEHFADWAAQWHTPKAWLEAARMITAPLPLV
ncbi:EAL domain-containing protein [Diaphorobacter sp. HDW4B]|uniref:EAL domain-containing protein n=1 Tax=Diaphorobacter sp. HDW4B TaxID=2714925 RepID=UPI00140E16ED|nr:EAL domain-containing protein [Diaphorobacter sp. HDW4B]QIL73133.1 EAL domain-containing protein [Diaphorobacter sp. HDW4B]